MKAWITANGIIVRQILGGRSKVFLVQQGNSIILFDTSSCKYQNQLAKNLEKNEVSVINALVLSHTHFDHAGNAAFVREKYHAEVLVHSLEAGNLRKGFSPISEGTNFLTRILVGILAEKWKDRFRYRPCESDIEVEDNYSFSDFGIKASLIHTPGHSPGMLSMIVDDEFALVGDTLFGVFPGTVFPPFADNIPLLIKSWNILLHTRCKWFLPSHGNPVPRKLLEKCYSIRKRYR
jgi:hydroxyacylglutathione hydrolase